MSPILTTDYLDEQLGPDYTGGGGSSLFNLIPFGPVLSLIANKNVYKDTLQASPATLAGDLVQQWRDEREVSPGNVYPYGNQATSGSRPTLAPTLCAAGGVAANLQSMTLQGLPSFDSQNCTLIFCGLPWTDESYNNATVQIALHDIPNQLAMLTNGVGADLNLQSDASYDGADHSPASPTIHLSPYHVLAIQSTPGGVSITLDGVTSTGFTAKISNFGSTGYLFDWSAHNATAVWAWASRFAIFSPALSPTNLATVLAGLQAETSLNSPWPLAQNVIAFIGDSLTLGIGHGTITSAQTYPAQVLAGLTNPCGHVLGAQTGKTIDQASNAWTTGINGYYLSTGRTGGQMVSFWAGTNDCEAGASGATMFADYKSKLALFKAQGWKVACFSIMNNAGFSGSNVTQQGIFNSSLRADFPTATGNPAVFLAGGGTTYADVLIDVQSEVNLQTTSNMTYFSDGTHLTQAGYAIVAADVIAGAGHFGIT